MAGALRELALEIGIEVDDDAVDDALKSFAAFEENIAGMVIAVGAALATATVGIAEFGRQTAVAIEQGSRQLGISRQEFQQWEAVARSAGAEGEKIIDVMANLQEKAQGVALDPRGEMAKTFERLGIAARDANGQIRTGPQLMRDAANALARMGPGTEQTATAMQLFGDAGRELLPVLGQGSAAIDRVIADFDRLGGGLDDEAIESSLEFNRALLTLKSTLMGALSPALKAINPILTRAAAWFTEVTAKMRAFAERSTSLRTTIIALITGAIVALGYAIYTSMPTIVAWIAVWAPFIAGTLAAAAVVAALSLAIDDLIVFLEGGDSAFGRLLDTVGGAGTAKEVLREIKDATEKIGVGFDVAKGKALSFATATYNALQPVVTQAEKVGSSIADALTSTLEEIGNFIDQLNLKIDRLVRPLRAAIGQGPSEIERRDENSLPPEQRNGGRGSAEYLALPAEERARVRASSSEVTAPRASSPLAASAQGRTTTVNGSHTTNVNVGGVVDTRILAAEVARIMREAQESMANDLADAVQGGS